MTDPDIDAAAVGDTASEEDVELEALESDLATIEAAMDRVDSGDLDGAEAAMARLSDVGSEIASDPAIDESE